MAYKEKIFRLCALHVVCFVLQYSSFIVIFGCNNTDFNENSVESSAFHDLMVDFLLRSDVQSGVVILSQDSRQISPLSIFAFIFSKDDAVIVWSHYFVYKYLNILAMKYVARTRLTATRKDQDYISHYDTNYTKSANGLPYRHVSGFHSMLGLYEQQSAGCCRIL